MFKYFNDEWNEKKASDDDLNIPRMERRIESADTDKEQKKIHPNK